MPQATLTEARRGAVLAAFLSAKGQDRTAAGSMTVVAARARALVCRLALALTVGIRVERSVAVGDCRHVPGRTELGATRWLVWPAPALPWSLAAVRRARAKEAAARNDAGSLMVGPLQAYSVSTTFLPNL
jgi:hypothetical protein